jgi:exodeoxyribonuclease VII large subunit
MQRIDQASRRLVHPAAALARQGREVRQLADRLTRALRQQVSAAGLRVATQGRRLAARLAHPLPGAVAVAQAPARLVRSGAAAVERATQHAAAAERALLHLNPQAVLDRGYAIVATPDGDIIRDADHVAVADDVALTFARGGATARITGRRVADG